jgi:hypothetical protein
MVSMLATRPKVCRFKPSQANEFLKAIKIHSTPSFRAEVKPEASCHKSLWLVRELYEYEKDIS